MKNKDDQQQLYQLFLNGEAIYDLRMLKQLEEQNYVSEVIHMFLAAAPIDLKNIQNAVDSLDLNALYQHAHFLKGSAGVLGADKLVTCLNQLERIAKSGIINVQTTKVLEDVQHHFDILQNALSKFIST